MDIPSADYRAYDAADNDVLPVPRVDPLHVAVACRVCEVAVGAECAIDEVTYQPPDWPAMKDPRTLPAHTLRVIEAAATTTVRPIGPSTPN